MIRQNGSTDSEVSILIITPMVPDGTTAVACGSGLVDLPLNQDGSDPGYLPSITTNDGTDLQVTYTCQAPVIMATNASDQLYKTVMIPIYYEQIPLMNGSTGITVTINFPDGSIDSNGNPMSQKKKKGAASGGAIGTRKPAKHGNHNVAEIEGAVKGAKHVRLKEFADDDGTNPANTIGDCRFQIIQSLTQPSQYFILIFVTGNSDQTALAQPPSDFQVSNGNLLMNIFDSQSNNMVQILGTYPSTYDQFSSCSMGNYNGPDSHSTAQTPIDNTPDDPENNYDYAITM